MRYIICGITILYAGLSMLAAVTQIRAATHKDTPIMMLSGGLLLVVAAFLQNIDWIVVIIGGGLICIAAFLNGKRSESFHVSHHIIRFIITLLLVIGFVL